ncbi:MAG: class I adenylate-forming enzyme family protein [Magnetospirillum sp.]
MTSPADLLAALPQRISHPLRRWAAERPDAPAVQEHDLRLSFAALAQAVDRTKQALMDFGLRPGDRLMIVNENCAELLTLILAASEMDAWAVIVNARLSPREIDTIQDHCGARMILFTHRVSKDAAAHGQRLGATSFDIPGVGSVLAAPLNGSVQPEPVETQGKDQVAALIYTSGTTGTPKGVMLTHRNILFVAAFSGRVRGLQADDLVYAVLPVSHVFGLSSVFMGTLYAGGCLMVEPRFSAEQVLADVAAGMTVLQGVPAMYAKILEHVKTTGASVDTHKLRYLSAGGSPLDPVIKAGVEKLFGKPLHNGYGLTEASPTISQTRIDDPRSDCSVGQALPLVEMLIVGLDGKPCAQGDVGELWSRGPGIMKGYYRNPDLTRMVIDENGWLNTGDFARVEADGSLYIVGRSKELIIRSGFNVYPVEVEAVLNAHPAVTQSAVVGRSLPDGNEDVIAFVQTVPGSKVSAQEIHDFAAQQLAPYKRPAKVVIMEHLPAGATGKILKNRLAEMAKSPS